MGVLLIVMMNKLAMRGLQLLLSFLVIFHISKRKVGFLCFVKRLTMTSLDCNLSMVVNSNFNLKVVLPNHLDLRGV